MRVVRRWLGYLRPYLVPMTASVVLLGASGALMSAVIATVKPLVNHVLVPAGSGHAPAGAPTGAGILELAGSLVPERSRLRGWVGDRPFVQVPLLLVVVFLARSMLLYYGEYLAVRAGASVVRDLRKQLYESVARQSLPFFQAHPTGLIVSRILNDVGRLQRVSTTVLADAVRVGAMVPFVFLVVLIHDWRMSLAAVVALPLVGYSMVRLGRRLRRASARSQERMAELAGLVGETVAGVKVVQGFGMEPYEIGRFTAALEGMFGADLRAGRAVALSPALMELVGALVGAAVFGLAGLRIARGTLDPGDFVVVLGGLGVLFTSVRRLNALVVELQQALAAADRVFELMDREQRIADPPGAGALPPFAREIVYEGVAFSYGGERVLDGIELTIPKGQVVALVGRSGSGKTTLAELLPRFYDPTSGRILIDGVDLRQVTLASLRRQIGLVTQETVLFDDTVRNNIAYGQADPPLAAIVDVARAAQADGFIRELPRGYDTVLGERGARLSVGQRQRIAIARALFKDPPILILDEATSALDAESETLLQRALAELLRGRTCLIIAHRLSTVRQAHWIVVLDRGRIVEQGTHRELIERGGAYARLTALEFREPGGDP
jgi:subfamily B ATP-binding cassette protein MsbA